MNNKLRRLRDIAHKSGTSIFVIQETWGRNPTTDYSIKGFHVLLPAVRPGKGLNLCGGVGLWIKETIDFLNLKSPFTSKLLETQTIHLPKRNLIIVNCYLPFEDQGKAVQELTDHLRNIMNTYLMTDLIITADFNIDTFLPYPVP